MIRIFWERYGQRIKIESDKRYVFYYEGGFCPPHAGHFQNATEYINYPNVKLIINQIGSEKRHGVPKNINRKIWKIYISKLLPRERVHLIQFDGQNGIKYQIQNHPWIQKSDVIIISRGDEFYDQRPKTEELKRRYQKLLPENLKMYIFYSRRNHEKLSATTFIHNCILYKNGNQSLQNLYRFLPSDLDIPTKNFIIQTLIRYNLH